MSSRPRRLSMAFWIPPPKSLFSGTPIIKADSLIRDSHLEVLQIRPRPSESFAALRIERPRRYLLNPGSIGQPRDGDPRAGFAIADLEHQIVEFWRVPYDIASVQERMRTAQLPEPLIQRLIVGR